MFDWFHKETAPAAPAEPVIVDPAAAHAPAAAAESSPAPATPPVTSEPAAPASTHELHVGDLVHSAVHNAVQDTTVDRFGIVAAIDDDHVAVVWFADNSVVDAATLTPIA